MDAEKLLESLPRFNVLQVTAVLCVTFICLRTPWQLFSVIFWAQVPQNFTCKIPETGKFNATQCSLIDLENNNTEIACTKWDYFDIPKSHSIITEWDLVCSNEYLAVLDQTLYVTGQLVGALFLAPLSDRFGRRPSIIAGMLIQLILAIPLMFSISIYMFIPLRFVMGCANQVIVTSSYVLIAEWFQARYRTMAQTTIIVYVLGILTMSGLSYLIRPWRGQILAYSIVPNCVVFILFFVLPESLFLLIANGRYQQVEKLMKRIKWPKEQKTGKSMGSSTMAIVSRASMIDRDSQRKLEQEASSSMKRAVREIVTRPKMLFYTLSLFWMSAALNLAYYVATINMSALSGNIYENNAISGAIEFPFAIAVMIVGIFVPRALLIFGLHVFAFGGFLLYSYVQEPIIYFFARGALSGCYVILVLFATEMFPTIVRNAGLGFFQVGENLGPIIGPTLAALPFAESGIASLYFVLSIVCLSNAIVISLMPETKGKPLPDTVSEIEARTAMSIWRYLLCKCKDEEINSSSQKEEPKTNPDESIISDASL